jgi:hypothetical protein
MHDQAIGPGKFNEDGSRQRIRVGPAPGLAKRGDMVDIYAQPGHGTSSPRETYRKGLHDGENPAHY